MPRYYQKMFEITSYCHFVVVTVWKWLCQSAGLSMKRSEVRDLTSAFTPSLCPTCSQTTNSTIASILTVGSCDGVRDEVKNNMSLIALHASDCMPLRL